MSITYIRLLLDFGLVVLIWMIQLIVYPSFLHYSSELLVSWHKKYTLRIAYIVMPLMFGQLGVVLFQTYNSFSRYTVGSLILVGLVWIATFVMFVPIHSAISKNDFTEKMLVQLVNRNWLRTAIWSCLFVLSLVKILFS